MRIYVITGDEVRSAECERLETNDPDYIRVKITEKGNKFFAFGGIYRIMDGWRLSKEEVIQDRLRSLVMEYNESIQKLDDLMRQIAKTKAL